MKNKLDTAPASDGASCSVLFIGGVADGQRILDPGERYFKRQSDFPVMPFDFPTFVPIEIRREESYYRREILRSGREEWVIYVLDSLTTDQAMGKLVCGYSSQNV